MERSSSSHERDWTAGVQRGEEEQRALVHRWCGLEEGVSTALSQLLGREGEVRTPDDGGSTKGCF